MRYAIITNNIVTNIIQITDLNSYPHEGLQLVQTNTANVGDSYVNNLFTKKEFTVENTTPEYKASILSLLREGDNVAIRCFKAGVSFPDAWKTYTTTLRELYNNPPENLTSTPTKPAYPANT